MYSHLEDLKNDLEAANFKVLEIDDVVSISSESPELVLSKVESFFTSLNYELISMTKKKNIWVFAPIEKDEPDYDNQAQDYVDDQLYADQPSAYD